MTLTKSNAIDYALRLETILKKSQCLALLRFSTASNNSNQKLGQMSNVLMTSQVLLASQSLIVVNEVVT